MSGAPVQRPDETTRPARLPRWPWLRRPLAAAAGPLVFAAVLAAPLPGLTPPGHRLAAVFAWAVVYWMTAPIPLAATAVGSSLLALAIGAGDWRSVVLAYVDPVILLFLGSFLLAAALQESELDRRFAAAVLRQEWATRTPRRLLGTIGILTCTLSLWLSNTATTALLLPVGQGILRTVGPALGADAGRYAIGLMLMLTWGSSVAVGLPIGSPPNLIAIGMLRQLTGRHVTLVDWVAVAMPLTAVMLALSWLILSWRYVPEGKVGATAVAPARPGPWRRPQWIVAGVFLAVCALWAWPVTATYEWLVALGGGAALLAVPGGRRPWAPVLPWRRALAIDWATLILFGGGIALGRLMFDTGLAEAIGRTLVRASGAEGVWALTAVAIVAGLLLSETASNTAAASVTIPVMIAVAQTMGASPVPPALGAALGASFGFMLPVSTPPNAIVFGSGHVPLHEMIRSGLLLDALGAVTIWLGLRVLCPLAGLM